MPLTNEARLVMAILGLDDACELDYWNIDVMVDDAAKHRAAWVRLKTIELASPPAPEGEKP